MMKPSIFARMLRVAVLAFVFAVALAPRSAAVHAQTSSCWLSVGTPYQSGSSVVTTISINCSAPTYIYVQGSLASPSGVGTSNSATCYGVTSCSVTVIASPFAYGTWTATGQGTQVQPASTSRTFVSPQPAYWLKLQSIECVWTNDATGGDEPRLYVNGVQVWSDDYFAKGDVNGLTGISRIKFSGSTLPIMVKEYDAWPGSTVTLTTSPGSASTSESGGSVYTINVSGGGANYRLNYIVVYEI
jgi:hypothetical protein